METGIIIALITGVCAVIGNAFVSRSYRIKDEQERAVKDAEFELRLTNIEHKLDVHNNYGDKLGSIAVAIAKIETELSALKEGLIK